MDNSRHPGFIHQHLGGHMPEFEKVDLLAVQIQNGMSRVGWPVKGKS
jgi:hypothetical protein